MGGLLVQVLGLFALLGLRARSRRIRTSWGGRGHALSTNIPLRLRGSTTGSSTTSTGKAYLYLIGKRSRRSRVGDSYGPGQRESAPRVP